MSQNGTVNVTLPNGQTVSLQSIKTLQAALQGKADKAELQQSIKAVNEVITGKLDKYYNGADIPDKSKFVKNIGLDETLKIGDYGLGGQCQALASNAIGNKKYTTSFFKQDGSSEQNFFGSNGAGIALDFDGGTQVLMFYTMSGQLFLVRHGWDGKVDWNSAWTAKSAKPDSTGVLRVSLPIIEIHPTGKFTTNDESEGATVSKLGLGHYQVAGVLGYNADGAWGVHGSISSPKNNNGLELIYIDDKVNKDGSITIETFHRQHSHLPARFQNKRIKVIVNGEKVYYQDGEPCDIPEGCRLDVRVQMPANSVWNVKQKAAEITTDSEQTEQME